MELCKSASGEEGCTKAEPGEITVLLKCLESPAASLRFAALQGLQALHGVLPSMHDGSELAATLIRRLWVARFDVDEDNAKIAKRLEPDENMRTCFFLSFTLCQRINAISQELTAIYMKNVLIYI